MDWDFPKPEDDPLYQKHYDEKYGKGAFERDSRAKTQQPQLSGPSQDTNADSHYKLQRTFHWYRENATGVVEKNGKFTGVACIVAKKVSDPENFVRRFGLSFERDMQLKAIAGLLEHLARSETFKAVLVTTNQVPFALKPDIREKILNQERWVERNLNYHRQSVDAIGDEIQSQKERGMFPVDKELLEREQAESINAKRFMEEERSVESQIEGHTRPFSQLKEKVFTAALFFYVYTSEFTTLEMAMQEIARKRYAAKQEISHAYFIACDDVQDPEIVFTGFVPTTDLWRSYGGLVLSEDVAGFSSSKDVAIALQKMFTLSLELPKEEYQVDEQIHIPAEEVSTAGPRRAFIGYVMASVVKDRTTNRRVYFPIDLLVRHATVFGSVRSGKSSLAIILMREALANGTKVMLFDPHGTTADRMKQHENLRIYRQRGDISKPLQEVYDTASTWSETTHLRLLIVIDETKTFRARNLTSCLNELGKRGVGFILITQYSTSLPAEARNVGSVFILSEMAETELQRFREVTLHPSAKLISRLPRATSYVFSPYMYPEPFFIRHRRLETMSEFGGDERRE